MQDVIIKKQTTKDAKLIEKALKQNDGYCPCQISRDDSTKCMCECFRNSIKDFIENNKKYDAIFCHCGLYVAYKTN